MKHPLDDILKINCAKTMLFGVAMFDLDTSNGFDLSLSMNKPRRDRSTTPEGCFSFYSELRTVFEQEDLGDDAMLQSAMSLWMNGFAPYTNSSPDAKEMTPKTCEYIKNRGYVASDQILLSRPDDSLDALFACVKRQGGERFIPQENVKDTPLARILRKGIVHPNWVETPLTCRYMVRSAAKDESSYDYLYLIGGSDEMVVEDLNESIGGIGKAFQRLRNTLDEHKNAAADIRNYGQISGKDYIWHVYKENDHSEDFRNHPITRARVEMKKQVRFLNGIVFSYDYLRYARDHLKIKKVIQFVDGEEQKVSIEDAINHYKEAYEYCKAITFMFEEFAAGEF